MKNPMSAEEKKQVIDDIEAGHEMEIKSLRHPTDGWVKRVGIKCDPNFADYQYRRKPELIELIGNVYEGGNISTHTDLDKAIRYSKKNTGHVRRIRLVEDPTWVEPEPEEMNPWRPIVKGEWPECKPGDKITIEWPDGSYRTLIADDFAWETTNAIKWKYTENE